MQKYPCKETLIAFLANVSLFKNAGADILSRLAAKTVLNSFSSGEAIINKGDVGQTMFLIFSGHVKVHDGEHKVAELEKGQFFGELSLLDSEPRSMSVTTLEDSVLGSINRDDFYEVLKEFPAMTKDIIAMLNNRLRNQNDVLISEYKTKEEQLKELVKIRTKELELALENLKKSQQQLVQSEKLASLGALIAGIAHEIQNPLNFVNNFSQLSGELIEEIKDVKTDDDRDEILADLKQNLEKINQHGRRADSIVKSMLEHSRTGTGEKQLTNINQLCTEYFNLAYHGMRAKNPEFNCELVKQLDNSLPEIKIVPQEISRVLLNLFNNAFYAVNEKSKESANSKIPYKPQISLITSSLNHFIAIKVIDNGTGIPDKIKEKIFEPFFTTKPTGQGTGLGLSLSFDIIKAHGGEIKVESKQNELTEFTVILSVE
ncbi:MAG: cyclic nucleotide-binding domain-containing protein [Bacteroidia bacterium]